LSPDQASPAGGRSAVQSIDRTVAILRCFDARHPELGTSDIARLTGLTTSTVHRLLRAMAANRLVRQGTDRRYALGLLVVQLARGGGMPQTLRDAAMPVLRVLRDTCEETAAVHELMASGERAVIDQVESHHQLRRTYPEIGVPLPLPQGAPGKALLAFLPWTKQVEVLSGQLEQITPQSITDPATLADQLARARARGFATSMSERTPGIRTVAAPVFDSSARVVGALSLSGPEMRMPMQRLEQLGDQVAAAAWSVSEVLGATPQARAQCASLAAAPGEGVDASPMSH
jgi:IclR family acetate operon transcriptional repressor